MTDDWRAIAPEEDQRIVPELDGLAVDFYRHLARGELCFQRCNGCQRFRHTPRWRCAGCGSDDFEWVRSAGSGKVFSWTVTHRPIDPGWAKIDLPYATLVVEMDEGVRAVGALRDALPEVLRLDLRVEAVIEKKNDDFAFLWFRPVD